MVVIRASLSEPHFNGENGAVVNVQRTMVKNGIATHLVWQFMYKQTQSTYGYFHISALCCTASCTDILYKPTTGTVNHTTGTVNHAMNNEMAKIMVIPY